MMMRPRTKLYFMCWSFLRSELIVTPRIHNDSTLIAPWMIGGTSYTMINVSRILETFIVPSLNYTVY